MVSGTTGVAGIQCSFDQGRVAVVLCGERCALGNHVVLGVVIYYGFAHADITNADLAGHIARNAGEDDLLRAELGNEHLRGSGGVGLAHTGAAHHHLLAGQRTFVVLHSAVGLNGDIFQLCTQLIDFIGHCAGKIYFIDNRYYLQIIFDCHIQIGNRLRLNALRGIHNQQSPLTSSDRTGHLV